jgi:hypothetical protein
MLHQGMCIYFRQGFNKCSGWIPTIPYGFLRKDLGISPVTFLKKLLK